MNEQFETVKFFKSYCSENLHPPLPLTPPLNFDEWHLFDLNMKSLTGCLRVCRKLRKIYDKDVSMAICFAVSLEDFLSSATQLYRLLKISSRILHKLPLT